MVGAKVTRPFWIFYRRDLSGDIFEVYQNETRVNVRDSLDE